ncbi:MAG: YceD family protein [Gammaproteobacteria bacterium]
MSGVLCEPVRIFEIAARGMTVEQSLRIAEFPRLAALIAPGVIGGRCVDIKLEFSKVADCVVLRGRLAARLDLQCQRCLQQVEYRIDHDIGLALIDSEAQVSMLPAGLEPILLEDCRAEGVARGEGSDMTLKLAPLLEDELMLQVPLVPMHGDDSSCSAPLATTLEGTTAQDTPLHPFAALAELKKRRD